MNIQTCTHTYTDAYRYKDIMQTHRYTDSLHDLSDDSRRPNQKSLKVRASSRVLAAQDCKVSLKTDEAGEFRGKNI